jgi:hypothetical protein
LDELDAMSTIGADEMTRRLRALFEAFVNNNKEKSLNIINDALEVYPEEQYTAMTKFDIAMKYRDLVEMEKALDKLEDLAKSHIISENKFSKQKAYFCALNGDKNRAKEIINSELKKYPQKSQDRILRYVDNF